MKAEQLQSQLPIGARELCVKAERVSRQARESVMLTYAHAHPRAARSLARFMGFGVDGSDADYRAMGAALHMLVRHRRCDGGSDVHHVR